MEKTTAHTHLPSVPPALKSRMVPPVLLLLLLLRGADNDSLCSEENYTESAEVRITYSNETGFDIHIEPCDLHVISKTSSLKCTWYNKPCYAWCSHGSGMAQIPLNDSGMSPHKFNYTTSVSFYRNCTAFYIHGLNMSCHTRLCTVDNVTTLLNSFKHMKASIEDLRRILSIKRICQNIFYDIVDTYTSAEQYVIHNVIKETNVTNSSVEHDLDDIIMTITSRNCCQQGSFVSAIFNMVVPDLIPVKTLIPLEAFEHTTEDRRKAAVVQYRSPQQFLIKQKIELVSPVICVEVLDKPSKPLMTRLDMTFTANGSGLIKPSNTSNETYRFSCQFYNNTAGSWSSSGCVESIVSREDPNSMEVQCLCDHMTPFAVLLIPELDLGQHWSILSYLSYIGCGLSALFSALSILTHYTLRKVQTDASAVIHTCVSGALLLLNSTFLMSEWASYGPHFLCVCVAIATEYALLGTFTWMAIEAFHLYLMLIRVFNTYYRHYTLKLSLVGWGVPAVLVSLSMLVKQDDGSIVYGPVHAHGQGENYCWITEKYLAYGLNVGFFSLVFVMNVGVLAIVSGRILRLRKGQDRSPVATAESGPGAKCRSLLTVLGLTCLLGITWGLAFLSYGYTNIAIIYLFCILNSLQGFFMFLWVFGTDRKKKRDQQSATHSSNVVDSFSNCNSKEELFTAAKLRS